MPDHPLRVAVCAVALMPCTSATAVAASRQDAVEQAIVAAVSQERSARGLPGVHPVRALARVADRHSRTMARTGVLTHGAFVRRLAPVVPGRRMGETIAYVTGSGRSMALRVVRGWMESPEHRDVLLDRQLSDVGVARRTDRGGWFVTADFAG